MVFSGCSQHDIAFKQMKSEEVIEVINNLPKMPMKIGNFHFMYDESLNDSSWLIHVQQNDLPAADNLGICNVLDLARNKIIIYSSDCKMVVDNRLTPTNMWPFVLDGNSHFLLVERRKGHLNARRICPPQIYSVADSVAGKDAFDN